MRNQPDTDKKGTARAFRLPPPLDPRTVPCTRKPPKDLVYLPDLAKAASFKVATLARLIREGKIGAWLSLNEVLVPWIPPQFRKDA